MIAYMVATDDGEVLELYAPIPVLALRRQPGPLVNLG